MKGLSVLLFIGVIHSGNLSFAQVANERIYHQNPDKIKVFGSAGEQTMAWCGGVNTPQFAMADLNKDGKNDLVIFESGGYPRTFLFTGTPGNPKYKYAPQYVSKFPEVVNYIKLVDYDRDGIPDLFHYGPQSAGGAAVCKGYYNNGQLCYDQCKDIRYAVPHSGMVNIAIGTGFMPAYVDVDGDTDIDIVVYSFLGSFIKLYKNFQEEDKLPKDAFRFDKVDECWGKVQQVENLRTHVLGFNCGTSSPKPDGNSQNKTTGGAHGICLLDGDGDGDYDLLDANSLGNELQYLENGRNVTGRDSMISQDTMWQSGKKVASISTYPVAYWLDIDNDGDNDILLAPFSNKSENYRNIHYYRNDGSNKSPSFSFKTDMLFQDEMIDLGENAIPSLFDYNKDGKPDLFVGSAGYYQPGGNRARISHYKNTTIPGQNGFAAETADFLGLSSLNLSYAAPAFGDLNGDGIDDMVVGKRDGRLLFFRNDAPNNNSVPNFSLTIGNLMAGSTEVNVGAYATPFIYDLDGDGNKDVILGSDNGKLAYFRNTGMAVSGKPALHFVTDSLGGVNVNGIYSSGYSVPFIGKIDNSGKEYLLVGTGKGSIYRYSFNKGNLNAPFTLIETDYSNTKVSPSNGFAAPVVFDVDGDGRYEMIVGTHYGGLMLYEQMFSTGIRELAKANKLQLYPNPARNEVIVELPAGLANGGDDLKIFNNLGQAMSVNSQLLSNNRLKLDIALLPPGLYMCVITDGAKPHTASFVKQ
ncbi:MAG: T9SS type A sorting domain-containing protein [Sphingobacteriales bacterium]|nr:MAG: T9SS type A sorting domain-containing protein [Sphingobacteriales bacterium]